MEAEQRKDIVARLEEAFGAAENVTPADGQVLHVLLPSLLLPEPWTPSQSRALTVWEGWPDGRPRFLIDHDVVGEMKEPPRSSDPVYLIGESWRQFSFTFPWVGEDPVLAIQLWMERFSTERT